MLHGTETPLILLLHSDARREAEAHPWAARSGGYVWALAGRCIVVRTRRAGYWNPVPPIVRKLTCSR
jgi:hypothetical protein